MGVAEEDEASVGAKCGGESVGFVMGVAPDVEDLERFPGRPKLLDDEDDFGERAGGDIGFAEFDGEDGAFAGAEALLEIVHEFFFKFFEREIMRVAEPVRFGTPGRDVVVEDVAVGDEELAVSEIEMAGDGNGGIVVAVEEDGLDVFCAAEGVDFEQVFFGLLAFLRESHFDGVAVEDEVRNSAVAERCELRNGFDVGSGMSAMEIGDNPQASIFKHRVTLSAPRDLRKAISSIANCGIRNAERKK